MVLDVGGQVVAKLLGVTSELVELGVDVVHADQQDDCSQAVGFDGGSLRKVEYAKRCFCSSARMRTALGR